MKAVVFHDIGDIRLEDVAEPQIEEDTDAIVRITTSAICGTDLHMIRGTMPGMQKGTIMGHEGVGVVESVEPSGAQPGPRRSGGHPFNHRLRLLCLLPGGLLRPVRQHQSQRKRAGTAFYGGPRCTGSFHGLQAEKARIPYAAIGSVRIAGQASPTIRPSCFRTSSLPGISVLNWPTWIPETRSPCSAAVRWVSSPSSRPCSWARVGYSPLTACRTASMLRAARARK